MNKITKLISAYMTFLVVIFTFFMITISNTVNVQADPGVSISLTISEVNFGDIVVNDVNDTTDDSPLPFLIENDGDQVVNITVEATDMWNGTGASNPSSYYQFKCGDSSEVACADGSVIVWTNMPDSGNPTLVIAYLNYTDEIDTNEVEIKLTVPSDEPTGLKNSTVTFIASQA